MTDDVPIEEYARSVAGDDNYDHAPLIHELCARVNTLKRRVSDLEGNLSIMGALARAQVVNAQHIERIADALRPEEQE